MSESSPPQFSLPATFDELAAARRDWIERVLHPWCKVADRNQLRRAEAEWLDIAGRVDVNATLWTWAWERFDGMTCEDLAGVNETKEVVVHLKDGTQAQGFPDARQSLRGDLVLIARNSDDGSVAEHGPFSIDEVDRVESVDGPGGSAVPDA